MRQRRVRARPSQGRRGGEWAGVKTTVADRPAAWVTAEILVVVEAFAAVQAPRWASVKGGALVKVADAAPPMRGVDQASAGPREMGMGTGEGEGMGDADSSGAFGTGEDFGFGKACGAVIEDDGIGVGYGYASGTERYSSGDALGGGNGRGNGHG